MIESAARLLAEHGVQGTSFTEVLKLTGAPRGSIYHHFPDGKDQLIGEAMEFAGARVVALLEQKSGESANEITRYVLHLWREVLLRSNYQAGCSVLAVTVATDSPLLRERAATVFDAWRRALARLLHTVGLSEAGADCSAVTLIASSEGAIVLGRAMHSTEPFDVVSQQLLAHLASLQEHPPSRPRIGIQSACEQWLTRATHELLSAACLPVPWEGSSCPPWTRMAAVFMVAEASPGPFTDGVPAAGLWRAPYSL